jgi:hypothetical protein
VNTSDSSPAPGEDDGNDRADASASRRNPLAIVVAGLVAVVVVVLLVMRDERGPDGPWSAAEALGRMNEGVALLEQYDYGPAYRIFEELSGEFPEWEAAWVNRGIAALNLQDEAKCVPALERALEINPKNCHALLSLGVQYHHVNRFDEALALFHRVVDVDGDDPHAHYQLGSVYADRGEREAANRHLRRAIQLQPSFGSAWYQLAGLHRTKEEREKRLELLGEFTRLRDSGGNILVGVKYGEGGKYSLAMRGTVPPGVPPGVPKRLEPAVSTDKASGFFAGSRSHSPAGWGVAITRPDGRQLSPSFALGDLTGDGRLEVVHCGVQPLTGGPRACTVSSLVTGRVVTLPFDPLLVTLGDLDGDSDLDVVGAGDGWLRAFVNDGKGVFTEASLGDAGKTAGFPVRLYTVDVDSDWDVDIVCLRQIPRDGSKLRSVVEIFNNNRDSVEEGTVGSFTDIAPSCGVGPFDFAAAELVVADLDGDIDIDFMVLDGESGTPHLFSNHRAWKFVAVDLGTSAPKAPGVRSTTGLDVENDGLEDLVLFCGDRLRIWRNRGGMRFEEDVDFAELHGALGGSAGAAWTLNASLEPGLVVLDPRDGSTLVPVLIPSLSESRVLRRGRDDIALATQDAVGGVITAIDSTGELQLVLQGTKSSLLVLPLDPHGKWIGIDLRGPKLSEKKPPPGERSNPTAIGASVEVRVGARAIRHQLTTGSGGTARNATRFVCGIGDADSVDQVRILWPDGILQSEIGLTANKVHTIQEKERKPSSCPVLFAWNGEAFEFVADFLGVGGLGYFEAPGRYSTPDPTEILAIPHLEPSDCDVLGEPAYELRILEPLEECTYLDSASLLVVDHPAETTVLPFEMFAVSGPPPGYGLLAFETRCDLVKAVDQDGRDVTQSLLALDEDYAPRLDIDPRFKGVLRREQAIEIEFPDVVDGIITATEDGHRPILFLWGYIEYGYSTTNFSASQAGFQPKAPSVRVERGGKWVTLRGEWGFPGGYPRWMAVDLGALLEKGDRRFRIDTNLEIAWDQVFLASARDVTIHDDAAKNQREVAGVRVRELLADRADLRYRGFPVDPPPGDEVEGFRYGEFHREEHYRAMAGRYTRYGDVRELLASDDDRFTILGPGDEVTFAVKASRLSEVATGQRRSFFLKSGGYCKDTDLYTGRGEAVEPLPFRDMSQYPYDDGEYPNTAALDDYRREWNTRVVEGAPMKMIGDTLEKE